MPHGRIQPRTWYVKFGLAVNRLEDASEHLAVPPSDSEIQICIKDVIDMSNRDGRRIRRLQHISFAYKSEDPANSTHSDTTPDPGCNTAYIVDVVGFAHGGERANPLICRRKEAAESGAVATEAGAATLTQILRLSNQFIHQVGVASIVLSPDVLHCCFWYFRK